MKTRPKQPTEKLKLHGAYRSDRHGKRAQEPKSKGVAKMPKGLSKDAQLHWQSVVPELVDIGIATSLDIPALVSMCEWWAEAQKIKRSKLTEFKRINLLACAHKQWRDLASRFGLTPSDRASLQVGQREDYDPAAEFIA